MVEARNGLASMIHAHTGHPVGHGAKRRNILVLAQVEELHTEFVCGLELSPDKMKRPQAIQHRKKLRGLSHLLTQCARSAIGVFHFWGRVALGSDQGST